MYAVNASGAGAESSMPHHPTASSPSTSARSSTENKLADNVTTISRQLLDSFAFSQVDSLVGDLAHMRQYLVSKLPDPQTHPLEASDSNPAGSQLNGASYSPENTVIAEYKGAIYGQRCLSMQQVILEYLLGRCLQQCQACLEELDLTHVASQKAEASTEYVVRHGQERGVRLDADALGAESAKLFKKVRGDLYELAEELRFLDGAREVTDVFLKNPASVLRPP